MIFSEYDIVKKAWEESYAWQLKRACEVMNISEEILDDKAKILEASDKAWNEFLLALEEYGFEFEDLRAVRACDCVSQGGR